MSEQEKITIIEGPPPMFEIVGEPWLMGLTESPYPSRIALCRVRTANGPALVERCYRAWRDLQSISLEYRDQDGITEVAPIEAVRWVELPEGDALLLWVRLDEDEFEIEIDIELDGFDDNYLDGLDEDDEDDFDLIT